MFGRKRARASDGITGRGHQRARSPRKLTEFDVMRLERAEAKRRIRGEKLRRIHLMQKLGGRG